MQLTKWTDYSLRVLMYCAANEGREAPVTISEIERAHDISRSHLTKVVMSLAALGYLDTTRGRGGGLRLLTPAAETSVGEVVRHTETDFTLLECFDPALNTCRLAGHCRLQSVLVEAVARFLGALDGVTLADLLTPAVQRFSTALPCAVAAPPAPRPARSKVLPRRGPPRPRE